MCSIAIPNKICPQASSSISSSLLAYKFCLHWQWKKVCDGFSQQKISSSCCFFECFAWKIDHKKMAAFYAMLCYIVLWYAIAWDTTSFYCFLWINLIKRFGKQTENEVQGKVVKCGSNPIFHVDAARKVTCKILIDAQSRPISLMMTWGT